MPQNNPIPAPTNLPLANDAATVGVPGIGLAGRKAAHLAETTIQRSQILLRSLDNGSALSASPDSDSPPERGMETPIEIRDRLRREGGRGRLLSEELRIRLKPFLTFDPAIARIHRGGPAAREARARRAQAFTVGTDIFFGERRFSPETRHGLGLLAHEMTHVGQQSRLLSRTEARHFTGEGGDRMEQEAQAAAKRVLAAFSLPAPPLQPTTPLRPSLLFAIPTVASPAARETAPPSFFTRPVSNPLPLANPATEAASQGTPSPTESRLPVTPEKRQGVFENRNQIAAAISARHADANAVSDRVYRLMHRELQLAKERGGRR